MLPVPRKGKPVATRGRKASALPRVPRAGRTAAEGRHADMPLTFAHLPIVLFRFLLLHARSCNPTAGLHRTRMVAPAPDVSVDGSPPSRSPRVERTLSTVRQFSSITLRRFMTTQELVQQEKLMSLSERCVAEIHRTKNEDIRSTLTMALTAINEAWFHLETQTESRVPQS